MRFLKRSARQAPRISLILLDWSVRESFHLLHYLREQTVDRDLFEVLVVEFYATESQAVCEFEAEVDSWVLLDHPTDVCFHKHRMYNVGIGLARGELVVICDSDAMVRPTFLQSILEAFEDEPRQVLHLDQFRSDRRDFYPFNYPSFEEVTGPGCINWDDGQTVGLRDEVDPLHSRNYGACMVARREDVVAIGGSDEHVDYLGYICGPYDLTWRLANHGVPERWHQSEFLYHTWHPGQEGGLDHAGPDDGSNISSTALECLLTGRTEPYVENPGIRALRAGESGGDLEVRLDDGVAPLGWSVEALGPASAEDEPVGWRRFYRGYGITPVAGGGILVRPRLVEELLGPDAEGEVVAAGSIREARRMVDGRLSWRARLASAWISLVLLAWSLMVDVPSRVLARWSHRAGGSPPRGGPPAPGLTPTAKLRRAIGRLGRQLRRWRLRSADLSSLLLALLFQRTAPVSGWAPAPREVRVGDAGALLALGSALTLAGGPVVRIRTGDTEAPHSRPGEWFAWERGLLLRRPAELGPLHREPGMAVP